MSPTANQDETLLLHLNEAIATIRDKETLFQVITNKLRLIFPFDLIGINVFDKELLNKRLFLRSYVGSTAASLPTDASATVFTPIAGSPVEQLVADPRIRHITLQEYASAYPDFEPFNKLRQQGIEYMTNVPLRLGGRLTGFLILAAARRPTPTAADDWLLEKIGSLVAVAVGNTLAFESIARRERERTMQLAINNALLSIKQREPLFRAVAEELGRVMPFEYFGIRIQRTGPAKSFEAFAEFSRVGNDDFVALGPDRPRMKMALMRPVYTSSSATCCNGPACTPGPTSTRWPCATPACATCMSTMVPAPCWWRPSGSGPTARWCLPFRPLTRMLLRPITRLQCRP